MELNETVYCVNNNRINDSTIHLRESIAMSTLLDIDNANMNIRDPRTDDGTSSICNEKYYKLTNCISGTTHRSRLAESEIISTSRSENFSRICQCNT